MTQIFHSMIAAILGISEKQIGQTLALLDDGATIPFISRYRKEMTGGLDEVQIESIQTHYEKLKETARRKETIIGTIREVLGNGSFFGIAIPGDEPMAYFVRAPGAFLVLAILVAIMNASGIKNRANKMTEGCDGCCASCSSSCDKKEG